MVHLNLGKLTNKKNTGDLITVSGPHGTGKSTYAKALAKALGLRYVCAGELFRQLARENAMSIETFSKYAATHITVDRLIDDRTRTEANKGNAVIDAQLGAWILRDLASVRLFLVAADEIRFKRIARREHTSFEIAKRETLLREQIQRERYMKYYAIDITDQTIYNLKIDTGLDSIESTKNTILQAVLKLLGRERSKPPS